VTGAAALTRDGAAKRFGLVIIAGLVVGVTASAGDLAVGLDTPDYQRVLLQTANLGSLWIGVAFLGSLWFRRSTHAAVAGGLVLVAAVTSYYVFGVTSGNRSDGTFADIAPAFALWSVSAVVAGPAVGILAHRCRFGRKGWSLVGSLAVPAALVGESVFYLWDSRQYFWNDPWRDGVLLVLAGVGIISGIWLLKRWRSRAAPGVEPSG
jgi:hypothetical protein